MTGILGKLLHLKEIRQAGALRALQLKRLELQQAQAALVAAEGILANAEARYGPEVDALYEPLFGQAIDLKRIEELEGQIADLDARKQELSDTVDDAADHVADLQDAEQALMEAYADKTRAFERLGALVDEFSQAAHLDAERQAELELEEGNHTRREFSQ